MSTTRGPYAKSAQVRRRVVEACVDAFAETGFHGATMKDVAQRSGISLNGLLHHFPKKEDLLTAVLEFSFEQSVTFLRSARALAPATDPVAALRGLVAVIVENEFKPGLMELHCVLQGEATAPSHPAHDYFSGRARNGRIFVADVFRPLAAEGRLRSDIAPDTLATMTLALIDGLQEQWLLDRPSVDVETAIRQFLGALVS